MKLFTDVCGLQSRFWISICQVFNWAFVVENRIHQAWSVSIGWADFAWNLLIFELGVYSPLSGECETIYQRSRECFVELSPGYLIYVVAWVKHACMYMYNCIYCTFSYLVYKYSVVEVYIPFLLWILYHQKISLKKWPSSERYLKKNPLGKSCDIWVFSFVTKNYLFCEKRSVSESPNIQILKLSFSKTTSCCIFIKFVAGTICDRSFMCVEF